MASEPLIVSAVAGGQVEGLSEPLTWLTIATAGLAVVLAAGPGRRALVRRREHGLAAARPDIVPIPPA